MADAPSFAATPRAAQIAISVANANRDGSGTITSVIAAGAGGMRIERVRVHAVGNTTDGMVRLFLHDGASNRLLKEIEVPALAPSAAVPAFEADVKLDDVIIPTGWSLRAATHNAENFVVQAFGGDF